MRSTINESTNLDCLQHGDCLDTNVELVINIKMLDDDDEQASPLLEGSQSLHIDDSQAHKGPSPKYNQDRRFDGLPEMEKDQDIYYEQPIPAEQEFLTDSAHEFWTWSIAKETWYYVDDGVVI
jgi:hypothetical protein